MKQLLLASALSVAFSSSFAAALGGSSTEYVKVGDGTALGNGPGISMPIAANANAASAIVDFQGGPIKQTNIAIGSNSYGTGYIKMKGVKQSQTWKAALPYGTDVYAYRQIADTKPPFPRFGGEVIAKVSGQDVYFGEWAPKAAGKPVENSTELNMDSVQRTVWYVGANPTTSMPKLTNAKYNVTGIRKFDPANPTAHVSTGQLTANYTGGSGGSLTGALKGGGADVNFSGTTIAANGTFQNDASTIQGRFYGDAANALAGMYKTGTPGNDVAFGGARVRPAINR